MEGPAPDLGGWNMLLVWSETKDYSEAMSYRIFRSPGVLKIVAGPGPLMLALLGAALIYLLFKIVLVLKFFAMEGFAFPLLSGLLLHSAFFFGLLYFGTRRNELTLDKSQAKFTSFWLGNFFRGGSVKVVDLQGGAEWELVQSTRLRSMGKYLSSVEIYSLRLKTKHEVFVWIGSHHKREMQNLLDELLKAQL